MVCAQLSFTSWLVDYYSHNSPCRTHSPTHPWALKQAQIVWYVSLPIDTSPHSRMYRLLLSKSLPQKLSKSNMMSLYSIIQFTCCQSICLTSHISLSNIQSGACNKLVIARQRGPHDRYWGWPKSRNGKWGNEKWGNGKWRNEQMTWAKHGRRTGSPARKTMVYSTEHAVNWQDKEGRQTDYGSNSSSEGTHSSYSHQFRVHRANGESVESATKVLSPLDLSAILS